MSFADDLAFLSRYTELVVLKSEDGRAQVAVAPGYQGRVMTSSAEGPCGASFGYVHRAGVAHGAPTPHMSVVGGEDRLWLGPEGGNFALYFAKDAPFTFPHWQVPAALDWGAWPIVTQHPDSVTVERDMKLVNYHGTALSLHVVRTVHLFRSDEIAALLGGVLPEDARVVGYESVNRVTNTGSEPWRRETGLVSIWILGMFRPAPRATVIIPFVAGAEGPIVRDDYFGKIGPDRLHVGEHAVLLRADGQQRGKLGIPFARARNVAGSYDPDARALTLVQYSLPEVAADYVSSTWELQSDPYAGDVLNSYNDGPTEPGGSALGPFYELESSSPALALAPGASASHVHRTFHVTGELTALDALAQRVLGTELAEIERAF